MDDTRREFLLKTGKLLVLTAPTAAAWDALAAGRRPSPRDMTAKHWWATRR